MSEMDVVEVRKYLPHRYPFLLVDRVLSIDLGKSIVALKNVTVNEPFFNGHFPSQPVMPGVLMVEAMAQASGILIYKSAGRFPVPEEIFVLAAIDNVRFKRMVVPGDQLRLEVTLTRERTNLWKFKGVASVDGVLACEAEFMNVKGKSE